MILTVLLPVFCHNIHENFHGDDWACPLQRVSSLLAGSRMYPSCLANGRLKHKENYFMKQCIVLRGAMRNYASGQMSTCLQHQQSRCSETNFFLNLYYFRKVIEVVIMRKKYITDTVGSHYSYLIV